MIDFDAIVNEELPPTVAIDKLKVFILQDFITDDERAEALGILDGLRAVFQTHVLSSPDTSSWLANPEVQREIEEANQAQ